LFIKLFFIVAVFNRQNFVSAKKVQSQYTMENVCKIVLMGIRLAIKIIGYVKHAINHISLVSNVNFLEMSLRVHFVLIKML